MSLRCPKCHNVMNPYERNGVVVDQCTGCRGLFLDRGELEKLVRAENGWYGDEEDPRRPEPRYEAMYESRPHYDERGRDHYRRSKPHKRRSFLEELFD